MLTIPPLFIKITFLAWVGLFTQLSHKIPEMVRDEVIRETPDDMVYDVHKLTGPLAIDADWDKAQWQQIKAAEITNYVGELPAFRPKTEFKMMYDSENVYVIFRVQDRYVRSVVQEYNGSVSRDSCVEFFFAPDSEYPLRYFNLEINAGGTPLIFYIVHPWSDYTKLEADDIDQIEIAHSLPETVDPEITEPTTWTIEYRIPLAMLEKFANVTLPKPGTVWKANFYKTGSKTSNPHWVTWSPVDRKNFHLPQFFGTIKFR